MHFMMVVVSQQECFYYPLPLYSFVHTSSPPLLLFSQVTEALSQGVWVGHFLSFLFEGQDTIYGHDIMLSYLVFKPLKNLIMWHCFSWFMCTVFSFAFFCIWFEADKV